MLSLTVVFAASPAPGSSLSFEEAWKKVEAGHEGIRAEHAALDRARNTQHASRAMGRPNIKLNASYTHLGDPVELNILDLEPLASLDETQLGQILEELLEGIGITPGDVNRAFTTEFTEQDILFSNLTALWPIYAGGRIDAARDIRQAQVREAKQRLDLKVRTTFEETAKYYFGVVLAKNVIETRKMAEAALEKHLDHAVKLEEQGQIARVERLSAQVTRDRAAVATRKAEDDLMIARLALGSLLGEEEDFRTASPLFVNRKLPPVEEFVRQTMESFPGLAILQSRSEAARGLLKVENGARLPEVFLFGNAVAYKDDSLASDMMPDWAVGVGLSFDLLDRTGQTDRIEATQNALIQIDHLTQQARRDLRVLVEKTWQEAVQARDEFTGLESSLELAKENIELREKAFAQGLSTSLEVVDAQLFLTAVRTQRMAAAYNYVHALSRLLSLSGQQEQIVQYQENGVEVTP